MQLRRFVRNKLRQHVLRLGRGEVQKRSCRLILRKFIIKGGLFLNSGLSQNPNYIPPYLTKEPNTSIVTPSSVTAIICAAISGNLLGVVLSFGITLV